MFTVALIGPDGAGKSTTIRTLLGLLHKTSGQARIFGMDCETQRTQILEQVGYLPSEVFYYDNMRAIDLLRAEGDRLHSRKLRTFNEPPFR